MTEQQKDFVHMYLKHRDKIVAHNLAYGNNSNYDSVESAANRLLRIPEIADTIRSIQDNIRYEVEQEFKAKYREELMTIYEKRLLLKKIATGELYVEQKYKGKNCTQCSQYISPTINQMLAALKEDSKLAGHHPFKQNGKWVIPALQTVQEQETELSPATVSLPPQVDWAGRSLPADGGGTRGEQDINPEKENKGQQITETTIDNTSPPQADGGEKDLSEPCNGAGNKEQHPNSYQNEETTMGNTSPLGAGGRLQQDENPPEKDNIGQQVSLSPAGGGVSLLADGGGIREEQDTPYKKDPSERMFIRAGNKGQQTEKINIDNQPLTNSLETSVDSSGNIISQEKLRELLYPQKPKLSYMKNNP